MEQGSRTEEPKLYGLVQSACLTALYLLSHLILAQDHSATSVIHLYDSSHNIIVSSRIPHLSYMYL